MDYNKEKNTITIFGKSEKIDTLVNKLASLNGEQVYGCFANRGIAVPRKMNCMALMSVLNERIKTLHASELSKDYFQRLKFYKNFSELQLFNLFKLICNNKEDFKKYRINLFKLILMNYVGLNLMDGEIKYLRDLKKLPMENLEDYFQYITSMCQEQEGTFDGQLMDVLRVFLVSSASNQEILYLAEKYGITLSTSLKKNELVEYMKDYLNELGELTKNLEYEIDSSTMTGLNSLCKKYRIPMSSNMTKNDMVTYLFYILSSCEIVHTSVRRIETEKMYQPLEFTVDMTVFKGFQVDDTKRIIHYDGEENDEFLPLESNENEMVVNDAPGILPSAENEEVEEAPMEEEPEEVEEAPVKEEPKEAEEAPMEEEPEEVEEAPMEEEPEEVEEAPMEEEPEEAEEAPVEEELEEAEEAPIEEVIYVDEDGNPVDMSEVENAETEEVIYVDEDGNPVEVDEQGEPVNLDEKSDFVPEQTKVVIEKRPFSKDDIRQNPNYGNPKVEKYANGSAKIIALSIIGAICAAGIGFILWALFK